MEDIELPDLPTVARTEGDEVQRTLVWDANIRAFDYPPDTELVARSDAEAAILADREKRAQAAQPKFINEEEAINHYLLTGQPVQAEAPTASNAEREAMENARHHISAASLYFANGDADNGQKILGDAIRLLMDAEDSPPCAALATQPTDSNAGERVDLSQWEKARFGYFDQAGRFVEFSGEDNELPNDSSPRWVGGLHDMQLLRAALATQQAEAPHSDLMKFYGVDNLSALVEAQHRHIEKLQAKLPRDDQPAFTRVREG